MGFRAPHFLRKGPAAMDNIGLDLHKRESRPRSTALRSTLLS
jgi:hypothetical protein